MRVMARIQWAEDSLVSLKLRDDLFTIGLLKRSPYMWFFDIHSQTSRWIDVDLDAVTPLFCVSVGRVVTQRLAQGKISQKDVRVPASLAIPVHWIKPKMNAADWKVDNFPWRGGSLIELDPNVGTTDARVIKASLSLPQDRALIESCELTNMWGDQDLSDRLCRFFDTGINRDDLKFEVFPELWSDREKLRPLTRRLPVPLR